jgi:hypothetical protein
VIRCLEVDRSILGPIRTRNGGLAENVVITDSIVQGFRTSGDAAFTADDVFDPVLLFQQLYPGRSTAERPLARPTNPLSALIWQSVGGRIPNAVRKQLQAQQPDPGQALLAGLLNRMVDRDDLDHDRLLTNVVLSPQAESFRDGKAEPAWFNRLLLEDAYPLALAPAACAIADATVHLTRVTVLGRLIAHRLHATDSILNGYTVADDRQDGCVRYSAALAGSKLPLKYNSAELRRGAPLFTSTAFGQPGYGQLLDTADGAIEPPADADADERAIEPPADGQLPDTADKAIESSATGMTLLAGSSSGAQIGAFPTQIVPVKEHALRIKYGEYLPIGLVPVIVHVT